MDVRQDTSQCFDSLLVQLEVPEAELCVFGVLVIVKVGQDDRGCFHLDAVVLEDVLNEFSTKRSLFLLCLNLRQTLEDVVHLGNR